MNYDHDNGKHYVVGKLGMQWDKTFAERMDKVLFEAGISQHHFDVLVREHCWRVKYLLSPASYAWWQRVLFALYFLNPFAKKVQ